MTASRARIRSATTRQEAERGRVEHDRDRVDPPRPALDRRHATVGAHRQVVHEMAGAVGLQQPVGALLALGQPIDVEQRSRSPPAAATARRAPASGIALVAGISPSCLIAPARSERCRLERQRRYAIARSSSEPLSSSASTSSRAPGAILEQRPHLLDRAGVALHGMRGRSAPRRCRSPRSLQPAPPPHRATSITSSFWNSMWYSELGCTST